MFTIAYIFVFAVCVIAGGLSECTYIDGFYFTMPVFLRGCAIGLIPAVLIVGILDWMYR